MTRIAIVGAGISGLTAAWQLTRRSAADSHTPIEVTLFEASSRAGGIIETVTEAGFVMELGPDSWVTEKQAAREFASELGLASELVSSNDETRKTYLLLRDGLAAMPDGLRLMVPTSRTALTNIDASPLFSAESRHAFRAEIERAAELQRLAPLEDESIATFVQRHFGREVLDRLAAPLLAGVFGGDVHALSVRAVMAPFVAMERERGSLIVALEEREAERAAGGRGAPPIFTTLRSGLGTLIESLTSQLPHDCLRLSTTVQSVERTDGGEGVGSWRLSLLGLDQMPSEAIFDTVLLATAPQVASRLLAPLDPGCAELLPQTASSAILVALAWPAASFNLPAGFGYLVPPGTADPAASRLLAATFVDQKFPMRVPPGGRLVRAFFGGTEAASLLDSQATDDALADLAKVELEKALGPLPAPAICHVRRWPKSLPQYGIGHLERVAALSQRLLKLPGLHVLGNGLRGVGLPDLIVQARLVAAGILDSLS